MTRLNRVWVDSETSEIYTDVRNTMGRDVICLSNQSTQPGFLVHVITKGGQTQGRKKQKYVLLKLDCIYQLTAACHKSVIKLESRAHKGTVRDITTSDDQAHLDGSIQQNQPVEKKQKLHHTPASFSVPFTSPISQQIQDSFAYALPFSFKVGDNSSSSSDYPSLSDSDSSNAAIDFIESYSNPDCSPFACQLSKQASHDFASDACHLSEQALDDFSPDACHLSEQRITEPSRLTSVLSIPSSPQSFDREFSFGVLEETQDIAQSSLFDENIARVQPAELTNFMLTGNKRTRDTFDSCFSALSPALVERPQVQTERPLLKAKKRKQGHSAKFSMAPKSWNVNRKKAPFRITITSSSRFEGPVDVAFAGERVAPEKVDLYSKSVIVEVPEQAMANNNMIKFQLSVDVELIISGSVRYKTLFKYKFSPQGAEAASDSESDDSSEDDQDDDHIRDPSEQFRLSPGFTQSKQPSGRVRLVADFDSLGDVNKLFKGRQLKTGFRDLIQNHINEAATVRSSFVAQIQQLQSPPLESVSQTKETTGQRVWRSWCSIMQSICEHKAITNQINHIDSQGLTILHYAAALGMSDTVSFLLQHGALPQLVGKGVTITSFELASYSKYNSFTVVSQLFPYFDQGDHVRGKLRNDPNQQPMVVLPPDPPNLNLPPPAGAVPSQKNTKKHTRRVGLRDRHQKQLSLLRLSQNNVLRVEHALRCKHHQLLYALKNETLSPSRTSLSSLPSSISSPSLSTSSSSLSQLSSSSPSSPKFLSKHYTPKQCILAAPTASDCESSQSDEGDDEADSEEGGVEGDKGGDNFGFGGHTKLQLRQPMQQPKPTQQQHCKNEHSEPHPAALAMLSDVAVSAREASKQNLETQHRGSCDGSRSSRSRSNGRRSKTRRRLAYKVARQLVAENELSKQETVGLSLSTLVFQKATTLNANLDTCDQKHVNLIQEKEKE
eukprot:CAMPEP_0175138956 /NCGR_PEP_ID=MMETSP0087-20121206/10634_1 /TAXON_ID=136419 /ORGANISM="Unknown Unknown, Strain D1" /LENGTH=949 /DNA_ID=CAMNT_0016421911 /DNA_START=313 /DNA_END=3159 /DNA_ORIENTATION=+